MAAAVFVYADGQVGNVDTPFANLRTIRIARKIPMRVFWRLDEDPSHISYVYDEFTRCGSNYRGAPIFCADGWMVDEVYMDAICPISDITHIDEHLRRGVRRYASAEYGYFIEMGEKYGELSFPIEDAKLKAQGLTTRIASLLVAHRHFEHKWNSPGEFQ